MVKLLIVIFSGFLEPGSIKSKPIPPGKTIYLDIRRLPKTTNLASNFGDTLAFNKLGIEIQEILLMAEDQYPYVLVGDHPRAAFKPRDINDRPDLTVRLADIYLQIAYPWPELGELADEKTRVFDGATFLRMKLRFKQDGRAYEKEILFWHGYPPGTAP